MSEKYTKNIDPNFQPIYTCRICKLQFASKREQLIHRKQVHERPDTLRYKCPKCSKGFASLGNLDRHLKNHSEETERRFPCPQCEKNFTQMTNLLRHVQTVHSGLRPFECEVCHKTFTQQGNLQRHQLTHTGEKPFKCKRCGRAFSQRINLKKHSMAHQGFRPFKCGVCELTFVQKPNLTKHLITHGHGVKTEVDAEDVDSLIVEEYHESDYEEEELVQDSDNIKEETIEMIIEPSKYTYENVYFHPGNSYLIGGQATYCEVINEEHVKTSE